MSTGWCAWISWKKKKKTSSALKGSTNICYTPFGNNESLKIYLVAFLQIVQTLECLHNFFSQHQIPALSKRFQCLRSGFIAEQFKPASSFPFKPVFFCAFECALWVFIDLEDLT